MCTFSLRNPGAAASDRDKLHRHHCPLRSVVHLLCSPCHQIFSRNRLSSEIVSYWVSYLSPMPLCCGQPLSYNILSSVTLWQSSPIIPSEIVSIRDSKKGFPLNHTISPSSSLRLSKGRPSQERMAQRKMKWQPHFWANFQELPEQIFRVNFKMQSPCCFSFQTHLDWST